MILFDLQCDEGHVFEGWFPDSEAYAKQRKRRQIVCPMCGSKRVDKAIMAPNINTGKSRKRDRDAPPPAEAPAAPAPAPAPSAAAKEHTAQQLKLLMMMREHVEKNCDYVGPRFAEEARRIHYGEVEKHNIYGEATPEETAELRDEGIEFGSVPWVKRPDS